jgi:serine/threonine protein kinase
MPEVFGEYLLVDRLGGRSMTEVFVAVRLADRSGRTLVLKRPRLGERASGPAAEALRREAEVLGGAKIPGAVRLEDSGVVAGLPFVVVEHVRGVPLDVLVHDRPLPKPLAMLVARDLGRTLASLHEAGWVHGDVAPANVMVDDAGELVLIDFGLAQPTDGPRPSPAGKAGYVAPEVARAKPARPADDVYAWGIVVAECLLGRRLFPETDLAEAGVRTDALPEELRDLPLVTQALSLDATARPASSAIAAAIEVDAGARDALAELTTPGAMASRATLEPRATRPMPDLALDAQTPSDKAAALPPPARREEKPPAPLTIGRTATAVVALAIIGAFAVGLFLGRRVPRKSNDATITLPMIPARTEVLLDGKTMLVPEPGRSVPIEPGKHTLSIRLPKRDTRDYEFVAEPGDHVVVVSVSANKGAP